MAKKVKLKEIEEEISIGDWVTIKAKVLDLWPNKSESISQIGLLGDETGQLKFISWKKSNLPNLNTGKVYRVKNAVVDEWKEELQLSLNKNTKINPLEETLSVESSKVIEGEILALTNRTGAISKCPECERTLKSDVCIVHGKVKPNRDIRIGLAIKHNKQIKKVEFSGNEAIKVSGLTLDKAHKLEEEELLARLEKTLVGEKVHLQYFEINQTLYGKNIELV